MFRDKYLANIDQVLQDIVHRTSSKVEHKNRIPYTEDLEKVGSIKKVAFDVYRVENDPYDGLWTLEDYQGKPYLIRASEPQITQLDQGHWTVTSDYDKSNVTLSYKKVPIARFSSDKYGFNSQDIIVFKQAILENISTDQVFIKDLLLEQPESKRTALVSTFPELKKIIGG